MEDILERMKEAREKADSLKEEKSRLSGELSSHENRLKELEKESQDKFGISVDELEEKSKQLEGDVKNLLEEAEKILEINNE